jgi:parallel beta-helix repeat protein
MNLKTAIIMTAASCCLLFTSTSAFSQGLLTPPGPPGPTMLTLSQIEPRTPIATNTTPGDANDVYIITQPGSYYLTTNLVSGGNLNGIEILANNVTLDLNGFALQSVVTPDSYNDGIYISSSQTNILVRNGAINGWCYGVLSASGASANLVFEQLNVANCFAGLPANNVGINILGAATIRDCTFVNNGYGITCNSQKSSSGCLITGCTISDGTTGIYCAGSGIISGCVANNCIYFGIGVNNAQGFLVSGCTANTNGVNIYVNGSQNRIEDNHVTTGGGFGIEVLGGTNNIIIRNSVVGGGGNNYNLTGTQIVGPLITTAGTITSANPWANFSF